MGRKGEVIRGGEMGVIKKNCSKNVISKYIYW